MLSVGWGVDGQSVLNVVFGSLFLFLSLFVEIGIGGRTHLAKYVVEFNISESFAHILETA